MPMPERGVHVKTGKIIKKSLKYLFIALLLLVFGLLGFRMCGSEVPKTMEKLVWNDQLTAAYQADPDAFSVKQQVSRELVASDGSFFACNILYIESAEQLQVTIRYTDHMMEELEEEIGADTLREEPFEYRLLAYEKTEDSGGGSSSASETREFTDYTYTTERKSVYTYRRLTFYNIDLNQFGNVIMQVYLNKDEPEEEPYKELTVRRDTFTWKEYSYAADLPQELKTK